MKCEQILKKLSAFIDNELNEDESTFIREHLKECRECAGEYQTLASAWDFMETGEEIEPSPYFWTRLSAEMSHREKEKSLTPGFWRRLFSNPVPAAAAAALIMGLVFGHFVGNALYPQGTYSNGTGTEETLALNMFDDLPSGSIGEAYYALLTEEAPNE